MAKFTPGPTVAAVSGSVGGTTYSRNRYGAYMRFRAMPVNTNTTYQQNARARLGNISSAWRGLTVAQRTAWENWAQTNPIVDALGQPQILQGNAAYIQLNTRLDFSGDTQIDVPPVGASPDALTSLTLTADIGAGTFNIAFTPTPIGAANKLLVYAAVVDSSARKFVQNLYKLIVASAADQATGLDIEADVTTRFGALAVGQEVYVRVAVLDTATGLVSLPRTAQDTVVSTV